MAAVTRKLGAELKQTFEHDLKKEVENVEKRWKQQVEQGRAELAHVEAKVSPVEDLVAQFVAGIYNGASSAIEARRVAQAMVGAAWCAERAHRPAKESQECNVEDSLQQVLARIKQEAHWPGIIKVEDGKSCLRQHGARGIKAASLLGKLSSGMNHQCHKVTAQLLAEIDLLSAVTRSGSSEHSSTHASTDDDVCKPFGCFRLPVWTALNPVEPMDHSCSGDNVNFQCAVHDALNWITHMQPIAKQELHAAQHVSVAGVDMGCRRSTPKAECALRPDAPEFKPWAGDQLWPAKIECCQDHWQRNGHEQDPTEVGKEGRQEDVVGIPGS